MSSPLHLQFCRGLCVLFFLGLFGLAQWLLSGTGWLAMPTAKPSDDAAVCVQTATTDAPSTRRAVFRSWSHSSKRSPG